MTTVTKVRIRWSASRDGVAHAHRAGNVTRTLCGLPVIAERDAWPERRRCLGCANLVDQLEARS